jgi:hypothetical protein
LEFFLRGHTRAREGEGLGERDVGAMQYARDGVARGGEAVIAGGILGRYFDETQRRQGVEAFCDRDVAGA